MKNKKNKKKPFDTYNIRTFFVWIIIFMAASFFIDQIYNGPSTKLSYKEFYERLVNNLNNPTIKTAVQTDNVIKGKFVEKENGFSDYYVYLPDEDDDLLYLLKNNVAEYEIEPSKAGWVQIVLSIIPIFLFIAFIWYFIYRGSQQVGGHLWSFGKSKAKMIGKDRASKITFRDVAGVDEAKEELTEVIAFLKDPKKFQKLGGRIPKGVLLVGPPGCGKTLLAKAVAGEADVPFFSISGSDFVEMFVGVGASRVRDLFEQVKKASKIGAKGGIIFIDEIDAVGRQRFAGIGGGHDEREQTLNQLLVEMDGFETEVGVIVMAATNRPDVLDPALLRPGRFDRHIVVDAPDIKGREEILKVHVKKIKLSQEVDLTVIAKQTSGFSGADLENLCNEAALLAARRDKNLIGMEEMQESMERVVAGPQRRSRVLPQKEKKIVAFHESGHAILSLLLPNVDTLHKVAIIPRGYGALGYTLKLPERDKYLVLKSELLDEICVYLGGRVAEKIIFGEISTGAHNDLEMATKIAKKMVTQYGMSDAIGNLSLSKQTGPVFLGRDIAEHKDYSDETAQKIDQEIKSIVEGQYKKAYSILDENKEKLNTLAEVLLEKEVLDSEEVKKVLGLQDDSSKENDKDLSKDSKNKANEDIPSETN